MTASLSYLGHATLMLNVNGLNVLTDPVLTDRVLHLIRRGPSAQKWLDRQPRPDLILISHLHTDHLHLPSLWRLPSDVPIVLPRGVGRWLQRLLPNPLIELDHGETYRFRDIDVRATYADHSGGFSGILDLAQGYMLHGKQTIYFPGDTDIFPQMAALGEHGIDLALMPIWGWGPTLSKGHLDPERAAQALKLLRPRTAIPIHWATFRPYGKFWEAFDYLHQPGHDFMRLAAGHAPNTNVHLLNPGENFVLT